MMVMVVILLALVILALVVQVVRSSSMRQNPDSAVVDIETSGGATVALDAITSLGDETSVAEPHRGADGVATGDMRSVRELHVEADDHRAGHANGHAPSEADNDHHDASADHHHDSAGHDHDEGGGSHDWDDD